MAPPSERALFALSVGIGCQGAVALSAVRRRSTGAVGGVAVDRERALVFKVDGHFERAPGPRSTAPVNGPGPGPRPRSTARPWFPITGW